MYAEIFALVTAFLRGFSTIPTRRGLQKSNAQSSIIMYLLVNTTFLWVMTLILYPLDQITTQGLEYFVLAGIFAPGIARTFRDVSIVRLGVVMTSPIVATNTLFAVIFATLFLQEPITHFIIFGAVLVVGGVSILSYRKRSRAWKRRDLINPFIAALLFAASTTIRKVGLQTSELPILGAAITSSISLIIVYSTFFLSRRSHGNVLMLNKEVLRYFLVASITSSIAFLLYFLSLSQGLLVRVQPIAATNPLFALLFSHLFLKDVEKINFQIVVGAALIFMGIIFVLL
ncbi:MAG: DMT family transporter [Candidatus Bathyarchaeota archaeon]|nr:DMT family transporter [Candidatus Bathyarchaeota archaeon]